ncbi:MAG: phenylalanine--tRNA ligase subunit alpha [Candidatus Omnitrophota bacterium]|nr:phenylalanine--tRNA ligase subunit alpha [Candidatus Omnitrophota bacterium]
MNPTVSEVEKEAQAQLKDIGSREDLEAFRIAYLGKKGKLGELMARLKTLSAEERRDWGREVNRLKGYLEESLRTLCESLPDASTSEGNFDETLPGIRPAVGKLHPISQTIREICRIFGRMGFAVVEGPEVETEFYNFTALNISLDHASRDSFDTFYTDSGSLLRSQTSTVQIRVMEKNDPPLRIIAPGRVYRPDTVDASHSFMFHQIEGLMVDDKTNFSELKGVLYWFLRELFGSSTKIRFRPHFFPFTEPSVEVDIQWGDKGWLEILGAGFVNPKVFEAVGYDTKKVRGFAFGLGVERIAMLRLGIPDIRYFYENDLRFLRQF